MVAKHSTSHVGILSGGAVLLWVVTFSNSVVLLDVGLANCVVFGGDNCDSLGVLMVDNGVKVSSNTNFYLS